MTKPDLTIQPSPYFYDVWAGLMKARGLPIGTWAQTEAGTRYTTLRLMGSGAMNSDRAAAIRAKMIKAVGPEEFRAMHRIRLAEAGIAA